MERRDIFNKVRQVVVKSMALDRDEEATLTETTCLAEELGADSMDNLSFMLDLERLFRCHPAMDTKKRRATFRAFETLHDLCNYVEEQLVSESSERQLVPSK